MDRLVDRRYLLALGGALALAPVRSLPGAEPGPPPPALDIPPNWLEAPRLVLWPAAPPSSASVAPPSPPAGWPRSHRRAVSQPELHVFRPAQPNGTAVLVIPGGAYWFVSFVNEGAELAPRLTERGYTVFVLTYRLPGEGWSSRASVPLQDAQRAMRLVRSRASEFQLDAARIAVLGFSAGGHLAATLATQHGEKAYDPVDRIDALDPRPFAAGLIYPVITMEKPWTHALSRDLLLGNDPDAGLIAHRSAERQVGRTTPPLFLVHAIDDAAVPVENSLRMMQAMREHSRPVEAHLLQEGGHAFGIGRPGTPSSRWIDLFCTWLERQPGT